MGWVCEMEHEAEMSIRAQPFSRRLYSFHKRQVCQVKESCSVFPRYCLELGEAKRFGSGRSRIIMSGCAGRHGSGGKR